jgi:ribosome-associated protein
MAKSRSGSRTPAKPKRSPARPKVLEPDPSQDAALEVARLALDKKALDVVVLDVRGLASYAEFFVLMTAESEPQLNAIADYLEEKMRERGERALGIEGAGAGRWVLIDFGDIVAHVFYQDARAFYDLEGLWADAPRLPVASQP